MVDVTASSSVRGRSALFRWLGRSGAHITGLTVGAIAAAGVWFWLGRVLPDPPHWALAALATVLAVLTSDLTPVQLKGSSWRVPRAWSRLPLSAYTALFGIALGLGVLTALSSPGLYLLIVWATTSTWPTAAAAFTAFAAGRAIPFAVIMTGAWRGREHPYDLLDRGSALAERLRHTETVLLTTIATLLLL